MTRPSALGRLPTDGDSAEEFAEVTLDGMGTLGDTTARLDGEPINVFGGIPGERVIARIWRYRRRRQSIVSGIVTEVLEPSPHRVSTPCPYVGDCTGCQWQHIEYGHQLHLKRQAILDWFAKSPGLEKITVEPAIAAGQTFEYRNHARFTVRRNGVLGFMNRITRRFIEIPKCILMDPWINETLSGLQGNCGETSQLSVRYGVNTGDWLVQPHLQDERIGKPTGQPYYFEELHGHRFRIGSPSFFQVNTRQAERLSQLVAERLRLSGNETVVDAYAGVGTFAVGIVADAGRVIAVEESSAAVGDAAINTLGMSNIEYRLGRTEEVVAELNETPDAVILDPSRVGCHASALDALIQLAPRRIVYVSCEPESLARDLSALVTGGYIVESVEPIDMFPHTHHVECVATLTNAGPRAAE